MSLGQEHQVFKSSLSVSRSEDVLTIRLGGEDHDGNTPFNVMEDLLIALDRIDKDPSIRVLVLSFADGGYDFGTDVLDLSNLLPDEADRFPDWQQASITRSTIWKFQPSRPSEAIVSASDLKSRCNVICVSPVPVRVSG